MTIALEVRFDKPVMPDALAEIEQVLGGSAAFHDRSAALFSSRSTMLRGQDFALVCNRVRAMLTVQLCDEETVVELDDATAYRSRGGLWFRVRPS